MKGMLGAAQDIEGGGGGKDGWGSDGVTAAYSDGIDVRMWPCRCLPP